MSKNQLLLPLSLLLLVSSTFASEQTLPLIASIKGGGKALVTIEKLEYAPERARKTILKKTKAPYKDPLGLEEDGYWQYRYERVPNPLHPFITDNSSPDKLSAQHHFALTEQEVEKEKEDIELILSLLRPLFVKNKTNFLVSKELKNYAKDLYDVSFDLLVKKETSIQKAYSQKFVSCMEAYHYLYETRLRPGKIRLEFALSKVSKENEMPLEIPQEDLLLVSNVFALLYDQKIADPSTKDYTQALTTVLKKEANFARRKRYFLNVLRPKVKNLKQEQDFFIFRSIPAAITKILTPDWQGTLPKFIKECIFQYMLGKQYKTINSQAFKNHFTGPDDHKYPLVLKKKKRASKKKSPSKIVTKQPNVLIVDSQAIKNITNLLINLKKQKTENQNLPLSTIESTSSPDAPKIDPKLSLIISLAIFTEVIRQLRTRR